MLHVLLDLCARHARPLPDPLPRGNDDFLIAYAAAGRRAGKKPLVLADDERARLAAAGVDWPAAERTDELYRVTLLVAASADATLAAEAFRQGDNDERRAVLRALPLLPDPTAHVPLAIEACRTNVVPIFEAIAAENPFPARHFPDLHFHQMVLKAVFLGVRLPRVIGLAGRVDAGLARMAADFAAERRAAGRPVPDDLRLLVSPQESR